MQTIDWNKLSIAQQQACLQRPVFSNSGLTDQVAAIVQQVKQAGDKAVVALTQKYDQAVIDDIFVNPEQFDRALDDLDPKLLESIKTAIKRIDNYQRKSLPKIISVDTEDGIVCQRIAKPIKRVGLYVPGGSAPLVSTLMMLAIPADIAGCQTRVLATPPNADGSINPVLLATAKLCGIDRVCKIGGAQAIAALAYGTETVPKVDKIYGPGNAWVTAAKQLVAADPVGAAIDLPAGPSEVLVIADDMADPSFVAADLLSQAEHGPDAQSILVTTSNTIAESVIQCVQSQVRQLSRTSIIEKSLEHCRIILVDDIEQAIAISNQYAPEHLILQLAEAEEYVDTIDSAGAVFVGAWTPETMGDYINGSNHVLPTYGYATTWSGLSVTDFMKYISVQKVSQSGLTTLGPAAIQLAEVEGLDAHANAVAIRLQHMGMRDE